MMIKYILGYIRNLFNPAVSFFALIDSFSRVNRKARVYSNVRLYRSEMDAYSYVGRNTWLVCAHIGKFCSIAGDCHIGMGYHTLDRLSSSPIFTEKHNGTGFTWIKSNLVDSFKHVYIGNDVWIGFRALVMGGVKIGDGAVIGAGAVVTKDVPPYAIVGGVPAKLIRYRFEEDVISKLIEIKWWNNSDEFLQSNLSLFQNDKISLESLNWFEQKQ